MTKHFYPIGKIGQAWGITEKQTWLKAQTKKRSFETEVELKVKALSNAFECITYGQLNYPNAAADQQSFALYCLKTKNWNPKLPNILITGGVHGYETSGVQGALSFLEHEAKHYESQFNFIVIPCVSPWGYEVVNRWNPDAIDPNRSFYPNSPAQECVALMNFIQSLRLDFLCHLDLHETTDSDENEFRPAKAARDGETFTPSSIPDGFYTVADELNPQAAFQTSIIQAVEKITHIAPSDQNNQIIGSDVKQKGVIYYRLKELSLCAGMTDALYTTTTEVYPDSPHANADICNQAQIAAIKGAIEYLNQKNA